jgi:hypothetical protein
MAKKPLKDLPLGALVARVHAEAAGLWQTCNRLLPLLDGLVPPKSLPAGERFRSCLEMEDLAGEVTANARYAEEIYADAGLGRVEALVYHRDVRRLHTNYARLEKTLLGRAESAVPF